MGDIAAVAAPGVRPGYFSRRRLTKILSLDDFERAAQKFLPRPIFGYVAGASESCATLQDNRRVFSELAFLPNTLIDVSKRSSQTCLFDKVYAAPFGISPVGFSALTAYRGDMVLASGAAKANIPMIMSGASLIRMEDVVASQPDTWFQIYVSGDSEWIISMLDRVANAGFKTLVVTVDMPVVSNRENNVRTGFSAPLQPSIRLAWDGLMRPEWTVGTFFRTLVNFGVPRFENSDIKPGPAILARNVEHHLGPRDQLNWQHIRLIRDHWRGRLIIKGIMRPDDGALAVKCGADGIIVSNHGGRQLDSMPSPLRVLPEITKIVSKRIPVMMDSGIRRGTDILKAIAFGADFVFIGRSFIFAAAIAGEAGVRHACKLLSAELNKDMALIGISSPQEITRDHLMRLSDDRI